MSSPAGADPISFDLVRSMCALRVASSNGGRAETKIMKALRAGSAEDWKALDAAVKVLVGETVFATWTGGTMAEVTTVKSAERPVLQLPYPFYSEPVQEVIKCLGVLGVRCPSIGRIGETHPVIGTTLMSWVAPVGDAVSHARRRQAIRAIR